MYISLPVLIGIGAFLALLLHVLTRRRGPRDLMEPPRAGPAPRFAARPVSAPPGALPPEVEAEARALMAARRKIEAIKIVRAATGLGLAEAKDLVERL